MKNKRSALALVVGLVVVLSLVCVVAQATVRIDYTYQDAHIMVTDSNTGWAAWVNYYTSEINWHGAYYSDFYVYWAIPNYNVWYGVFSYNATYGTWGDVLFEILTY